MKNSRFYTILAIELVAVIAVGLYFFVGSADIYKFIAGNTKFYHNQHMCDLHEGPCSIEVEKKGLLTLEIEPKTIPLMKPLIFKVTTSQELQLDELDLTIFATNMNMGYHIFKMKKKSDKTYQAEGILPACIVGKMTWRAEVVMNHLTQSLGAVFTFQTE
jgi:hypothetical protein